MSVNKQHFSLSERINSLELRGGLSLILEEGRPLQDYSLQKLNQHVDKLLELREYMQHLSMSNRIGWVCDTLAQLCSDPWSGAVLRGCCVLSYTGEWNGNACFFALCQAAGGCLTHGNSEVFRVALSMITQMSGQPCAHDPCSGMSPVHISTEPTMYKTSVNLSLTKVKGAEIAQALFVGLAADVAAGKVTLDFAWKVGSWLTPWRYNSQIREKVKQC